MGCGASKGTEGNASSTTQPPAATKSEFTPETKPRPIAEPEGVVKAKESPESATRRVDVVAKSDAIDIDYTEDRRPVKPQADIKLTQELSTEVIPPPPVTPPAAAKKPLFQTADTGNLGDTTAADSTEASYFPAQVALNVGGGAEGYRQQSWQAQQDSVKAFDLSQSASLNKPGLAAPAAVPPEAAAPAVLRSSTSSRQLQPLLQQQQLQLQQQPSSRVLPPLQGQPLTESGPGPASTSSPLVTQPAAAAASADDPWSSLQSTYRIRDPQQAPKPESTRSREASSSRDAGREVLVLGDDDDDEFGCARSGTLNSTANSAMNRTSGLGGRPPASLPPPQFGSGPKKGGWGSGAMAQAGELMIGEDDWLVNDRPPGSATGSAKLAAPQRQQQQQQQAVLSYNSRAKMVVEEEERHAPVTLKGPAPPPKNRAAEDVLCEDVEDVDMLLETEMERQGLSNKSLASKLAAYEAQFEDEDD